MVDERGRRRFAVGPGDANHFVGRQFRSSQSEQFDIANDRHPSLSGALGQGVGVERYTRRHNDRIEPGKANGVQVSEFDPRRWDGGTRGFPIVPSHHLRAAGRQRRDNRQPAACQPQHRISFPCKGLCSDHRSFSVARPLSASTMLTIQNRMTTVDSAQPSASK